MRRPVDSRLVTVGVTVTLTESLLFPPDEFTAFKITVYSVPFVKRVVAPSSDESVLISTGL